MRRRDLLGMLGGAALAPFAAHARQVTADILGVEVSQTLLATVNDVID